MKLNVKEFRRRIREGLAVGKAETPAMHRDAVSAVGIDEAKRQATFVISDATRDRARDSLYPEGMDGKNYAGNPILLFAHDYSSEPIGRCVAGPELKDGKIVATFEFLAAEVNPQAERIWKQVCLGTLRAVSVGFIPTKTVWNDAAGGCDFITWELLEVSVVPVPCNPAALILDGKSIDDLETLVKGLRAKQAKATDDEAPPADGIAAEMAECMASFASSAKAMEQHCGTIAGQLEAKAAMLGRLDSATKSLEDCVKSFADAMSDDPAEGDDTEPADKAVDGAKKKGASHAMSKAMVKHFGKLEKAAAAMRSLHDKGEEPAEDDTDAGDDKSKAAPVATTVKAEPVFESLEQWREHVRGLGRDPDVELAGQLAAQLAHDRGGLG
jgi:HK97 family phage prohead protease